VYPASKVIGSVTIASMSRPLKANGSSAFGSAPSKLVATASPSAVSYVTSSSRSASAAAEFS